MIAVADASPVCYLILIGEIDLLPQLFGQVLLPRDVLDELLVESSLPAINPESHSFVHRSKKAVAAETSSPTKTASAVENA